MGKIRDRKPLRLQMVLIPVSNISSGEIEIISLSQFFVSHPLSLNVIHFFNTPNSVGTVMEILYGYF